MQQLRRRWLIRSWPILSYLFLSQVPHVWLWVSACSAFAFYSTSGDSLDSVTVSTLCCVHSYTNAFFSPIVLPVWLTFLSIRDSERHVNFLRNAEKELIPTETLAVTGKSAIILLAKPACSYSHGACVQIGETSTKQVSRDTQNRWSQTPHCHCPGGNQLPNGKKR